MRKGMVNFVWIAATLVATGAAPCATAHEAHVHGQALIQVSMDESRLSVVLDSALDNLLGFEHAPRNEKQRQQVKEVAARLRQPDRTVLPDAKGGCVLAAVKLDSPVLAGTPAHDGSARPREQDEHANMTATYQFNCARMQDLRAIEVTLFEGLPRLKRIEVQIVGPRGQSAQRLNPTQRRISL